MPRSRSALVAPTAVRSNDTEYRLTGRREALCLDHAVLVPDRERAVTLVDRQPDRPLGLASDGGQRRGRTGRTAGRELAQVDACLAHDTADRLSQIAAPTLILSSVLDTILPPRFGPSQTPSRTPA
jgi:pimeloyl-ACP methyl ester carboxylesterase